MKRNHSTRSAVKRGLEAFPSVQPKSFFQKPIQELHNFRVAAGAESDILPAADESQPEVPTQDAWAGWSFDLTGLYSGERAALGLVDVADEATDYGGSENGILSDDDDLATDYGDDENENEIEGDNDSLVDVESLASDDDVDALLQRSISVIRACKPKKEKRVGPIICEVCQKVFLSLRGFREHRRLHTGEKPYKCKKCGLTFTFLGSLRSHEKKHLHPKLKKPKKAPVAPDNPVPQWSPVPQHSPVNLDDPKPFVCSLCPARFAAHNLRRFHETSHAKKNNVVDFPNGLMCPKCPEVFYSSGAFDRHKYTAHSKRPLKSCLYCPASFTWAFKLREHIEREHTKIKPFTCDNCGQGFFRKDTRNTHVENRVCLKHAADVAVAVEKLDQQLSSQMAVCCNCGIHVKSKWHLNRHECKPV